MIWHGASSLVAPQVLELSNYTPYGTYRGDFDEDLRAIDRGLFTLRIGWLAYQ